jgi:hypothetical protein
MNILFLYEIETPVKRRGAGFARTDEIKVAKDIGTVRRTVHPRFDNLSDRSLARRDVFPGGVVGKGVADSISEGPMRHPDAS